MRKLLDNGIVGFIVATGAILLVGLLLAVCLHVADDPGPSADCRTEPTACEP